MFERKKICQFIWAVVALLVIGGAVKFYHYNYVANTLGQARTLRLTGLKDFLCKGEPFQSTKVDHCGKRAIYMDPDWGITAYYTIYGVESREDAAAIAQFMVEARKKNNQENIPMNLQVYSLPRSGGGNGPVSSSFIIYDKDL